MLTSTVKKELGSSVLRYIRKQLNSQATRKVFAEVEVAKITTYVTAFLNEEPNLMPKTTFNGWTVSVREKSLVAVKGDNSVQMTQNAGTVFITDGETLFQQVIGADPAYLSKKFITHLNEN